MNLSVIAVSGPQGVPGNGANLSGQYPIEIANSVVSINSSGYTSPAQLASASGAIVSQIQAASAGVSSLNGLSGFVYIEGRGVGVGISGSTILLSGESSLSTGINSPDGAAILRGTTGQLVEVVGDGTSGTSPPSSNLVTLVVQPIYGATGFMLGAPDGWWSILVSGRQARVPYYYT